MIQAALLSSFGVVELDENGLCNVLCHDPDTGLLWLTVIQAEPGGPVVGNIIRADPGTMGRTLFHFRTTTCDGQHRLADVYLDGSPCPAPLPSLSALCAFMRSVWAEMEAGRVPDLEALGPLHLGLALPMPPAPPGESGGYKLWFGRPE